MSDMKLDNKKVVLDKKDFDNMVSLIHELKKANKLLNEQIREYNEQFANKTKDQ